MSILQLLPSSQAGDIADGLRGLVARFGSTPSERLAAGAAAGAIWGELAAGGWTELADPSDGDRLSLLDLCSVAEVWAGATVEVPFTPTLATRRWLAPGDRPAGTQPLTYGVAEGPAVLAPFGHETAAVATWSAGVLRLADPGSDPEVDSYAPSLPLARCPGGAGAPPPEVRHEWVALTLAEAVGAAAQALDSAVRYVSERRQFGRPVGSFQGLKHRMADMHRDLEMARAGLTWCCAEPDGIHRSVPAALGLCSSVTETAVHVHGGFGFTWECDAHWYLRHVGAATRLAQALLRV